MKKSIILKSLALLMITSISYQVSAGPPGSMTKSNMGFSSTSTRMPSASEGILDIQNVKNQADQALSVLISRLEKLDPIVRSESFKTLSPIAEMLNMLEELEQKNVINPDDLQNKLNSISDSIAMTVMRMKN